MSIAKELFESSIVEKYESAYNVLLKSFNEKLEVIKNIKYQYQLVLQEREMLINDLDNQKQYIVHMEGQLISLHRRIISQDQDMHNLVRDTIEEKANIMENFENLYKKYNDLILKYENSCEENGSKTKIESRSDYLQWSRIYDDSFNESDIVKQQCTTGIIVSENILQSFDKSSDCLVLRHKLLNLPKDGFAFEQFCCSLFRHMGYRVQHRGMSGDNGIDFDLRSGQKGQALWRAVGQCKNYPTRKITAMDIREFLGAMWPERVHTGYYLTSSCFTCNALETAASLKEQHISVELWDIDEICRRMEPYASELLLELQTFDRNDQTVSMQRQRQDGCNPKYTSIIRSANSGTCDDVGDEICSDFTRLSLVTHHTVVDDCSAALVYDLCDKCDDDSDESRIDVDTVLTVTTEIGRQWRSVIEEVVEDLVLHCLRYEEKSIDDSVGVDEDRFCSILFRSNSCAQDSETLNDSDEFSVYKEEMLDIKKDDHISLGREEVEEEEENMDELIWKDVEGCCSPNVMAPICESGDASLSNCWSTDNSMDTTIGVVDKAECKLTSDDLSSHIFGEISPVVRAPTKDKKTNSASTIVDNTLNLLTWATESHNEKQITCMPKKAICRSPNKENVHVSSHLIASAFFEKVESELLPDSLTTRKVPDIADQADQMCHDKALRPDSIVQAHSRSCALSSATPSSCSRRQQGVSCGLSIEYGSSPSTGTGSEWTIEEVQYLIRMVERFRENGKTKRISWYAMERWLLENSLNEGTDTYELCPIKPIHFSKEKLRNKWKNDLCKLFV